MPRCVLQSCSPRFRFGHRRPNPSQPSARSPALQAPLTSAFLIMQATGICEPSSRPSWRRLAWRPRWRATKTALRARTIASAAIPAKADHAAWNPGTLATAVTIAVATLLVVLTVSVHNGRRTETQLRGWREPVNSFLPVASRLPGAPGLVRRDR